MTTTATPTAPKTETAVEAIARHVLSERNAPMKNSTLVTKGGHVLHSQATASVASRCSVSVYGQEVWPE